VRVIRTGIELTVLAAGWLLGGTVGIGTLVYAVAIGPIIHRMLPIFSIEERKPAAVEPACAEPCAQLR
jgi:uncharacterized membrane protein YczE